VDPEQAQRWAERRGFMFYEVSLYDRSSVEQFFNLLLLQISDSVPGIPKDVTKAFKRSSGKNDDC
jgi:hypothetical protein